MESSKNSTCLIYTGIKNKFRTMKRINYIILFVFYLPLLFFIKRSELYDLFREDQRRWVTATRCPKTAVYPAMVWLLMTRKDYRNIYYLRCPRFPRSLKFICRPDDKLELATHGENNYIEGGGTIF